MKQGVLSGYKTYVLAVVAIVAAAAGYLDGDLTWKQAVVDAWFGGVFAALRAGVASMEAAHREYADSLKPMMPVLQAWMSANLDQNIAAAAASHGAGEAPTTATKQEGFMRISMLWTLAAASILALIAGCSTQANLKQLSDVSSYNPANYQGCTAVHYMPGGKVTGQGPDLYWVDCKDKASVHAIVDLDKGTIDYSATNVNGSAAAALRSQVEQIFSQNGAAVTPAITDAITKVVGAAMGFPLPAATPTGTALPTPTVPPVPGVTTIPVVPPK